MTWVSEAIGWAADACFLLAYFLVSRKKIEGSGKEFNFLNLGGAILYGTYAIIKHALPIFILEAFWGVIAITALKEAYKKK